ncbi:kinesin-like protein NACK2 [Rhododendron vialii]|uniref:kinesin-like protein NACK2 n=1 Tax=Rhododendron vialii TaxID=182163 RepID=UPI00265E78E8|nr:kinesin-like protein NACK2 [Rhododendron vialii]
MRSWIGNASMRLPFCSGTACKIDPCFRLLLYLIEYLVATTRLGTFMRKERAKEIALSVVSGINSSIFAYGQTSSGKTYTMVGITEYTVANIYDYIHRLTMKC